MTNTTFTIGQVVNYKNGSKSVYTGTIVKIKEEKNGIYLVVIGDESGMILWNAGISCGSYIHESQVIK